MQKYRIGYMGMNHHVIHLHPKRKRYLMIEWLGWFKKLTDAQVVQLLSQNIHEGG